MTLDDDDDSPSSPRPCTTLAVARELVLLQMSELLLAARPAREIAPIMLWGPPGIGKSDLVRGLCHEHGWGFVDVRLAQRDPVDLRGLPVPTADSVRWLPSSEWPRDPASRGILLFDELTAADRTLQVAAYELILDRRLGDTYELPPGWLVCAAGNRSEDRSVAVPMSAALANRFLHLDVEADIQSWCEWALAAGVRTDVIAFLRSRTSLLFDMRHSRLERGWPSPRSWARVSAFLDASGAPDRTVSVAAKRAALAGLVGPGPAIELLAFVDSMSSLPDLVALLEGRERLREVPTRSDLLYALAIGLARVVWTLRDREKALGIMLHVASMLPPEFAAALYAETHALASGDQAAALASHPALDRLRPLLGDALAAREHSRPTPSWQSSLRPRRKGERK
jgi:hypothetical protein